MAQSANVVRFALGSGAFLCFVELFRSLRAAWALWDSWKGSVRFGQRGPYGIRGRVPFALGSGGLMGFVEGFRSLWAAVRFICHRRTRPGWGRSPPRPQHPRLPLSPSPLRGPLGLPRPAPGRARYGFLPFSPSSRIPAACPGLPRTPRRGRWGPTPSRYFQVF